MENELQQQISNLLRKQLDSAGSDTTSVTGGTGTNSFLPSPRTGSLPSLTLPKIHVQANEPLPRKLEVSMYEMMSILRSITRRISDGMPLRHADWDAFSTEAFKLAEWTKRVEFDNNMNEEDSAGDEKETIGNNDIDVEDPPAASSQPEQQGDN
jgi:hypothetical protein